MKMKPTQPKTEPFEEVAAIIDISANVEIQGQIDEMQRNKSVIEHISQEMAGST